MQCPRCQRENKAGRRFCSACGHELSTACARCGITETDTPARSARKSGPPEARDYFTRALEIFERLGTLIEPDRVRAELAGLPAA